MSANPYKSQLVHYPKYLFADPKIGLLRQHLAKSQPYEQLWVDLGCGAGTFLLQRAQAFFHYRFVGFEMRYKRLVRSAQKAKHLSLHNVWFLRERAESFDRYFSSHTLDRLYVLFPDPWPKLRDWNKRLLSAALLEKASKTLKMGGLLCVKTDYSGQFLHFLTMVHAQKALRPIFFSNNINQQTTSIGNAHSEFEMLFQQKKQAIYGMVLQRQAE